MRATREAGARRIKSDLCHLLHQLLPALDGRAEAAAMVGADDRCGIHRADDESVVGLFGPRQDGPVMLTVMREASER
jgi:hypothetical protein